MPCSQGEMRGSSQIPSQGVKVGDRLQAQGRAHLNGFDEFFSAGLWGPSLAAGDGQQQQAGCLRRTQQLLGIDQVV